MTVAFVDELFGLALGSGGAKLSWIDGFIRDSPFR